MRLLFLLTTALLMSCSGGPSNPQQANQHLRLNISTEPPSLHPMLAHDVTSAVVLQMLFEGLTRVGPSGQPEPALAERIAISEDGKSYTFFLRNATWSNGDPVTADDFVYSLRTRLAASSPSPTAYKLYLIQNARAIKTGELPVEQLGVEAVNKTTLRITLEHPAPYFLDLTASHLMFPFHPATHQTDPHWARDAGPNFVSNGPFLLERWRHHDKIVVRKNPDYWDADNVHLEGATLGMVEDGNTTLAIFEDGGFDWIGLPLSYVPSEALDDLRSREILQTEPMHAVYFYMMNTRHPLLTNSKIRRALAYSINRQAIVDNITGREEVPTTSLVPPALSSRKAPFFADHDIGTARALFAEGMQELGLSEESLPTLTISYNTEDDHHRIAQYIQQVWARELGLPTKLANSEWKAYIGQIENCAFDVARLGWSGEVPDASTFLNLLRYERSTLACVGWSHDHYRRLLADADEALVPSERDQLFLEAEEILASEMPIAPLFVTTYTYLQNPQLHDVLLNQVAIIDFRWARFSEE